MGVLKRTDLDMLCKSTTDPSECASGVKDRMNVYGLVMALLITMTWSMGSDASQLEIDDQSMWFHTLSKDKAKDIVSWYCVLLYLSAASFMIGILTVVEILDRTAVTPVTHSSEFFLAVHDSYLGLPNFFLFFGTFAFIFAMILQASAKLAPAQFMVLVVLIAAGVITWFCQFRHGVKMNRAIVDKVVESLHSSGGGQV
jgi:hypothetical protein